MTIKNIQCSRRTVVWLALATSTIGSLSGQSSANQRTPLMDRQKEIALALSACPPSVASKAAVYVLDRTGYIKVRDGGNGFTAIVQHAVPTSQDPQCMDAEGTRTFLPRYLKVAEWRAQGKSTDEIKLLVADAFAKGIFQPPAKPGIDYMLSPEDYTPNAREEIVHFPPHVMFYAPYLTAEIGLGGLARSGRQSGGTSLRRGGRDSSGADYRSCRCALRRASLSRAGKGEIMAKVIFGNHSSVIVPRQDRDSIRRFYCDVLGATITKAQDERDFVRLGEDFYVVFMYGDVPDESEFLRTARSVWLEIKSDNVEEMRRKILESGLVRQLEIPDPHLYFQAPGGQCLRLVEIDEDLSFYEGAEEGPNVARIKDALKKEAGKR